MKEFLTICPRVLKFSMILRFIYGKSPFPETLLEPVFRKVNNSKSSILLLRYPSLLFYTKISIQNQVNIKYTFMDIRFSFHGTKQINN